MRSKRFWSSITAGFALLIAAGSYRVWANDDGDTFTIDVACDARTYPQNNVDPSASGSNRGDTFIVQGKIFPGGTIPQGNNVFSPDNAGSIGSWICRGTWLVNFSELATGASPAFDTTQIYLLPMNPSKSSVRDWKVLSRCSRDHGRDGGGSRHSR